MFLPNHHLIHIHPVPKPPPRLPNLHIIPTHHPLPHHPVIPIRPILQSITPLPDVSRTPILILVPELHGDFILVEREQLFAQPVVFLPRPFLREEVGDCGVALQEGVSVAPDAGRGVGGED